LVHADFGSNNVLTDNGRITAVIDWSEAMFGDSQYEVANIFFWRPWLACMEQQTRYFERRHPELAGSPGSGRICSALVLTNSIRAWLTAISMMQLGRRVDATQSSDPEPGLSGVHKSPAEARPSGPMAV